MSKALRACATIFMEGRELYDAVCNVYEGRGGKHDYGFAHRTRAEAKANDDEWLRYRIIIKLKEKK